MSISVFKIIVSVILIILGGTFVIYVCLEYGLKIFKKKEKTPKLPIKQVEQNISTWAVYWYSIMDKGFHTPTLTQPLQRVRAFPSEELAQAFSEKLKAAYELLQCGYEIRIYIEKQQ